MKREINLRDYERIVFFTGAGVSAESGIPTYRGKGGLWHEYNYEEYACQRAFDADPEKVWEFHNKRREFFASCQPARGHQLIADIEAAIPSTTVVTQNIDGMHQRAGSQKVFELHGSIWRVRCDEEQIINENLDVPMLDMRCSCGAFLRPDIVWFEDPMNLDVINNSIEAVSQCDLLITIGTSAMVYPAAQLPFFAFQRKIPTIEINIEETPMSDMYSLFLEGTSTEMLGKLWE